MNTPQPDNGKRIGQGMWIVFWVILLFVLAWFFGIAEDKREYPNQNIQGTVSNIGREVTLAANRGGHYTLTGEINGNKVQFLLDTGASDVVIPGDIAKRLNLKAGRTLLANTANGTITVYKTELDELSFGPIQLRNVSASINPHMQGDILLGMSALRSLEMIHRDDQLLIRQRLN